MKEMLKTIPLKVLPQPVSDSQKKLIYLLSFFLVFIIYFTLSFGYYFNFLDLFLVTDFWFGADVSRHIYWAIDADKTFRSHLHPFSFALFKAHGWVLSHFANLPGLTKLPTLAFPIMLYTSASIILVTKIMVPASVNHRKLQIIIPFIFLVIGPTLVFAPITESHVLGGVSLLIQAALIGFYLQQEFLNEHTSPCKHNKLLTAGILFFAFLATGFTLSNLMPAVIVLLAVSKFRRPIILLAVSGVALVAILLLIHYFVSNVPYAYKLSRMVIKEMRWINLDFSNLFLSFKNIVMTQFGVAIVPEISVHYLEDNGQALYYVSHRTPNLLQITAFLCWVSAILYWVFHRDNIFSFQKKFVGFCALSLFSIVAFHSFYATIEAYIFSVHAWPYLVLPGIIVLANSMIRKHYVPLTLICFSLVLSVIQLLDGLSTLLGLEVVPYESFLFLK